MKAWFEVKFLQNKVGIITDQFCDYFELKEIESGEYYIRHISKIHFINR